MERAITVLLTTLTDLVAIEGYEFGDAAGQVSQDDGAERLQGRGLLESEVKALLCYRVQGAVKAFDMSFFDGQNLYRLLHGRSSFCPCLPGTRSVSVLLWRRDERVGSGCRRTDLRTLLSTAPTLARGSGQTSTGECLALDPVTKNRLIGC